MKIEMMEQIKAELTNDFKINIASSLRNKQQFKPKGSAKLS
jgi:hypothetical protein